jgi:hypothetical protein
MTQYFNSVIVDATVLVEDGVNEFFIKGPYACRCTRFLVSSTLYHMYCVRELALMIYNFAFFIID